jgi:virginiamycin B lyase
MNPAWCPGPNLASVAQRHSCMVPARIHYLAILTAIVCLSAFRPAYANTGCAAVDECVRQLAAASQRQHNGGITGLERDLAEQLVKLGPLAVPALIPLLDNGDRRIAGSAAYALSQFGSGASPAIPALGRSLLRGNGWASVALGETKSDAAIPELVAGALAGQSTAPSALIRMGPAGQRAAGDMLGKALHVDRLSWELELSVKALGNKSALVTPLTDVAANAAAPLANRILACKLLGIIGTSARHSLPALRALADGAEGQLATAAGDALNGIGDRTRIATLIAHLKATTGYGAVQDVIALSIIGPDAHEATPLLVERAENDSWDNRADFVRGLGWIGDARAVPFLAKAMTSQDWRVSIAAVRALGRLRRIARPALAALAFVERTHWLPRMRTYASDTRALIEEEAREPSRHGCPGQHGWDEELESRLMEGTCEPVAHRLIDGWTTAENMATEPPPGLEIARHDMRSIFVTYATNGGLLIGTNRGGEWGGEVIWLRDGRQEQVTEGKVLAIVARPWGLVVLQHRSVSWGVDGGLVTVLIQGPEGHWSGRPFLELPGAPIAFRTLSDGGMDIATTQGTVAVGPTGHVRAFECKEAPPGAVALTAQPPASRRIAITQYEVPTAGSYPARITTGPDGALWFTEQTGNNIGRITVEGSFTEYPIPTPNSAPEAIVLGPDGALWFTEQFGNKIGRVTTGGIFTEYPIPVPRGRPFALVVGSDHALWFTYSKSIGRLTTAGSLTGYPIPTGSFGANAIALGPDGALWFTDVGWSDNRIGRITVSGAFTKYPVSQAGQTIFGITSAPDRAVWFTLSGEIGRITDSGLITRFAAPGFGDAFGITVGPDGDLWMTTSSHGDQIGRMSTTGRFAKYTVPATGLGGIATGPDGALWFTDGPGNTITRVEP